MSLISKVAGRCPAALQMSLARATLAGVLLSLVILLNGCGTVKQYSIESYQGPMSAHDLRYTGIDSVTP